MALDTVGFVSFAFAAGAATFFAPCSYPLLPGYLAYFIGESTEDRSAAGRPWRAAVTGFYVVVGFALVFGVFGAIIVTVGSHALANAVLLEPVIGVLLVVLGTRMTLGRSAAFGLHIRLPKRRRRATSYVLFGIVYAVAAAGCTAPLFIAIAGVSLRGGLTTAALGIGGYAAGMSTLLIAVTVLCALGRDAILDRLAANTDRITRAAGALLVLAGLVQIYLFFFVYGGLTLLRAG